jgi:hypothetical protein
VMCHTLSYIMVYIEHEWGSLPWMCCRLLKANTTQDTGVRVHLIAPGQNQHSCTLSLHLQPFPCMAAELTAAVCSVGQHW